MSVDYDFECKSLAKFLRAFTSDLDNTPTMSVFTVFADESGKQSDLNASSVAIGGIVVPTDEQDGLARKWAETMGNSVKHISMKEAMSFNGQFKNWDDRVNDRDDLLEALAKVAFDRSMSIVGSTLDVVEFKSLPQEQQKRLRNVIYAAFESICRNICVVGDQRQDRTRFHLVYDLSEEYSVQMLRLFHRIRMTSIHYRDTIRSISFVDDEISPGLQAADMVAYCLRQRQLNAETARTGIVGRLCEILFPANFDVRYITYSPGDALGDGKLDPKL